MAKRKRHSTEQIIHKLREAEVELSKGKTVAVACRKIGVTEQTTTAGARSTAASRWPKPSVSRSSSAGTHSSRSSGVPPLR